MPWIIRAVLTLNLLVLPLFVYLGLRIASSYGLLRGSSTGKARRAFYAVLSWLMLFPVVVVAENLLGITKNRFDLVSGGVLVDFLVVYPYWVALIAAAELVGEFLLLDLASLASRLFPSHRPRWIRSLAYVRLVLGAGGILFVSFRAFLDTSRVHDTAVTLNVPNLPSQLEDLRLTLVADLQVDHYTGEGKILQLHRIVDSRRPELLLCAGDIVTGGTDYVDEAARAMCSMKGSVASIAVMGDHDYWSAPEAIAQFFRDCGWDFLENEHRVVAATGKRILVTGLTHIYSHRLNPTVLDSLLRDAPPADVKILLVHQPAEWLIHSAARHGYDLVLAGHTHGGQIVVHPFGIPFTPSMRETRFYSGEYRVGTMTVVVTNGIGLTLAPLRYCAPAQVTTVVLRKNH